MILAWLILIPTDVPESSSVPRTPRTPRTPGRQDPTQNPTLLPCHQDSGNLDGKVCCPRKTY